MIVPINQPKVLPGVKSRVFNVKGKLIRITSVLGVAFMDSRTSNPFEVIDEYLDLPHDIHIIDFHGEATSEKSLLHIMLKIRQVLFLEHILMSRLLMKDN